MSRRVPFLAIALAFSLGGVTDATAQGPPAGGAGGGQAAERRSERADENANAQWQEDSLRGKERAATRRHEGAGEAGLEGDESKAKKARREKKTKSDQKPKTRGSEEADAEHLDESSEEPLGAWERTRRFFGFGRSERKRDEASREREKASEKRPAQEEAESEPE